MYLHTVDHRTYLMQVHGCMSEPLSEILDYDWPLFQFQNCIVNWIYVGVGVLIEKSGKG